MEKCDCEAGGIEEDDKLFVAGLVGVNHEKTGGGERISLLLLLEKALADGARKLGFTAIRTVNTSVVTQVLTTLINQLWSIVIF